MWTIKGTQALIASMAPHTKTESVFMRNFSDAERNRELWVHKKWRNRDNVKCYYNKWSKVLLVGVRFHQVLCCNSNTLERYESSGNICYRDTLELCSEQGTRVAQLLGNIAHSTHMIVFCIIIVFVMKGCWCRCFEKQMIFFCATLGEIFMLLKTQLMLNYCFGSILHYLLLPWNNQYVEYLAYSRTFIQTVHVLQINRQFCSNPIHQSPGKNANLIFLSLCNPLKALDLPPLIALLASHS